MQTVPNRFRSLAAALIAILALSVASFAQSVERPDFSRVRIKNFGQMDERFYRGAQPKEGDYADLKAIGIRTVIDLRDDPTSYEKGIVESLGMRYVNLPMVAKQYPKEESVAAFLRLVDDPSTGKFFVHCAGGRHRTGVMGAVYRFNKYGWGYDRVYAEMKAYDFYTRFGHGDFKRYVEDYWQRVQSRDAASSAVAAALGSGK